MIFISLDISGLADVLQNLIIQFAYNVKKIEHINQFASFAWMNSREASVPLSWKKLLIKKGISYEFNWCVFLQTRFDPFSISTLISLKEVRNTIRLLNWTYLKKQKTAAAIWVQAHYKCAILRDLFEWTPQAAKHIFFLQRLLCSVNIPECINRSMVPKTSNLLVQGTSPLCFYVNPIRFGIF